MKSLIDYYQGKTCKIDDKHIALEDGRIYSIDGDCFLSAYEASVMNKFRHMVTHTGSRWDETIAECFVPKQSPKHKFLHHIDGNMDNCSADNLVWRTYPQRECYPIVINSSVQKIKYHDLTLHIAKSPPDIKVRCLIELYELLYDSPMVYY